MLLLYASLAVDAQATPTEAQWDQIRALVFGATAISSGRP